MSTILEKDLKLVLPSLTPKERSDAKQVLNAIESRLPERRGAYTELEIRAALRKSLRESEGPEG